MRTVTYSGSAPGIRLYRCGGSAAAGASLIRKTPFLKAQTCLNSGVIRELVGETVRLLLSSLEEEEDEEEEETQSVYLKSWHMRARFCETRNISPWVQTAERNWGRDIRSCLTRGNTVMGNGGRTPAKRFVVIRFLHFLEGNGIPKGNIAGLGL